MFKRKKPLSLGVDIGTSSVKVMEMSESRDRYRVEHFAVEPLPRNTVVDNAITDVDRVSKAIKAAVSKSGSRSKHAVISIAAAQAMNKIISVPSGLHGNPLALCSLRLPLRQGAEILGHLRRSGKALLGLARKAMLQVLP